MSLPPYFMEWINLKDIYLNFYKRRVSTWAFECLLVLEITEYYIFSLAAALFIGTTY